MNLVPSPLYSSPGDQAAGSLPQPGRGRPLQRFLLHPGEREDCGEHRLPHFPPGGRPLQHRTSEPAGPGLPMLAPVNIPHPTPPPLLSPPPLSPLSPQVNSPVRLSSDADSNAVPYLSLQPPPGQQLGGVAQFEDLDLYLWPSAQYQTPSLLFYAGPVRFPDQDNGTQPNTTEVQYMPSQCCVAILKLM